MNLFLVIVFLLLYLLSFMSSSPNLEIIFPLPQGSKQINKQKKQQKTHKTQAKKSANQQKKKPKGKKKEPKLK